MLDKKLLMEMNKDDFYSLAKIIDNGYIGTLNSFSYELKSNYYLITTNECDYISCIRIYEDGKITRIGDDTDGYEEIQKATYESINQWILEKNSAKD